MSDTQFTEEYIYTFKIGKMYLKTFKTRELEFTEHEHSAYKVKYYDQDTEKDIADAIKTIDDLANKFNMLGIKGYIINKQTVKTEVSNEIAELPES